MTLFQEGQPGTLFLMRSMSHRSIRVEADQLDTAPPGRPHYSGAVRREGTLSSWTAPPDQVRASPPRLPPLL